MHVLCLKKRAYTPYFELLRKMQTHVYKQSSLLTVFALSHMLGLPRSPGQSLREATLYKLSNKLNSLHGDVTSVHDVICV